MPIVLVLSRFAAVLVLVIEGPLRFGRFGDIAGVSLRETRGERFRTRV
jgi:hypothetical protein